MSHPIRCLSTLHSDVFLLNSHPGLFTVTHKGSPCAGSPHGHPLSRSYGVILPSSLERVLSSVLPFSGYLPVSDYGTSSYETLLEVFLGSRALMPSPLTYRRLPSSLTPHFCGATDKNEDVQHFAHLAFCVILEYNVHSRCWNINQLSIAYAFRPRLRID